MWLWSSKAHIHKFADYDHWEMGKHFDRCPPYLRVSTHFEWVLRREVNIEEEDAAFVDGAGRAQDGRHPLVYVVTLGAGAESIFKDVTVGS